MNQSVKASLLSALVFPGVGQISLGYKKRGWSIIAIYIVFLYLIISEIMQKAYSIINEMQKNGAAMDIESISVKTSGLVGFSDNTFLNILLMLFIIGWVISIVDAYGLGKKYS